MKRNSDLGIARMNVRLPAKTEEILLLLDQWAMLIRQLGADDGEPRQNGFRETAPRPASSEAKNTTELAI